ncbi:MAG: FAD-binding oxidoreductase [Bacteroidia bacterium]|jgi:glycine/D-amino acid oxidase-like deaminating enzyme|nr:FAD-binding oxidoreductase [Bacteroidia bacterium]
MQRADYLIAGQGLSGSILALTLLEAGKTVHVIDRPELSASSRVAAGIYNPFNFRRMVNTWEAETVAPFATAFYRRAEQTLGASFHQSRPVWKILADAGERALWQKACAERTGLFAQPELLESPQPQALYTPHGIGVVNGSGSIDTVAFITAVKQLLRQKGALTEAVFDETRLRIHPDGVEYNGQLAARRFVNCQGHLAAQTALFAFLPLRPMKGEVLHLHIAGLTTDAVLNRGAYLLPLGNQQFICGATYEAGQTTETTTETARTEMLGKLAKFITAPITVNAQFAGVRPAVKDRRPLLGVHPQHGALAVFNGMGSKAAMLAPWLATQLLAHLENNTPLPAEVNLNRFTRN